MCIKKCSKNRLTAEEVSVFCLQTAYLLSAGVPLYEGIPSGIGETKNKRTDKAFALVSRGIMGQNTLERSMTESECFPDYACSMVGLGEASGRLEEVLFSLARYYDKENRIKNSLRQAVVYPAALFCIMAAVVAVLIFKVLPMFEKIFARLGGGASSAAASMMSLGRGAGITALAIISAVITAAVFVKISGRNPKGRLALERLSMTLPIVGNIISQSSAVRFASAVSLSASAGTDLNEAMTMAAELMDNSIVKKGINEAKNSIMQGESFAEAIEKSGVFPLMFSRMAEVGMKTGNLDSALDRLSDMYTERLEEGVNTLINTVEPALVGIIALITGMILTAVLLPLTGIMASIG